MKLYRLLSGPLRVNSYFLAGEDGNAVLIDGGENYKLIKETQEKYGLNVKALLLTHAHFDHAGNAAQIAADGATVYVSEKDGIKLASGDTLAARFGRKAQPVKDFVTIKEGDVLDLFGMKIEVLETAGHTDGSLTFKTENALFTGDTLFKESVGRTDFPTGNFEALVKSVQRLFSLEGDYDVYPGHDEFTTLSHERAFNPMKEYERNKS